MDTATSEHQYGGPIKRPKKSILRRWAFTNAVFFFIAFGLLAVIIYASVVTSFIGGEKERMLSSMSRVETQLRRADGPLTSANLDDYFDYHATREDGAVQLPQLITSMIGSKNQFFIYNTDKDLIFSTTGTTFPFYADTKGDVRTVRVGDYRGYLESRPVRSARTGKIVAYMQNFYNLNPYYLMRARLITLLITVTVLAIVAVLIFSYAMAGNFLRPLRQLSRSMTQVAAHPERGFEPVNIRRDDEIKQIADFYNAMMQRINESLEHQKRFMSDASHELRTPLAVIDGNLQMLLRWGFDDKALTEENVRIAADEASQMTAMLKDMLDLSRLESLPAHYLAARCEVAATTQELVRNFRQLNPDFAISYEDRLSAVATATAQISKHHFAEILTILLENAIKYSPADRREISVVLAADEACVELTISDQGIGISEEDRAQIFERFFRADKARSRAISGTGLGLAILSNILKLYRGEVRLTSRLDMGSTFTVRLPRVVEDG